MFSILLLFSTLLTFAQDATPAPFPLDRNELVQARLDYYEKTAIGRKWIKDVFGRMQNYREMIEAKARLRAVPKELMMVAAVESGFQPRIVSRQGPAGLWQFIAGTARKFGLKIRRKRNDKPGIDERLDAEKSTEAAMKYFSALYKEFGDWRLVLLAYNEGEEGVRRAMRRLKTRDPWKIERNRVRPRPSYLANVTALAHLYHAASKP